MSGEPNARILVLVAVLPTLAACGDGGRQSTTMVRDSAGIEIVQSERAPEQGGTSEWEVSAAPVLVLGGVDIGGPEQFTSVSHVTRLNNGEVVVFEQTVSELRFFDSSGRHQRTIGGRGDGPGEFRQAWGMTRTIDDSLMVRDLQRRSLLVFSPVGDYVRQEQLDGLAFLERVPSTTGCFAAPLFPDGSFLHCASEPGVTQPSPSPFPEQPERRRDGLRLVRVSWDLSRIDTLGVFLRQEHYLYFPEPGSFSGVTHPFYSDGHLALATDPPLLFMATNPHYSVEAWTSDGQLERIIRRSGARRQANSEEHAAAMEEVGAQVEAENRARIASELPVPDSVPAIFGLAAGPAGELWVQREPFLETHEQAVLDVFDPHGRFLGSITLPTRLMVKEVGEDYILGVRTDDFNVPLVEMYTLKRR